MRTYNVIWYFRNAPNCNGIELKGVTLDEAKEFVSDKTEQLRSRGKQITIHHEGEISYPLISNRFRRIGDTNVLVYQIN